MREQLVRFKYQVPFCRFVIRLASGTRKFRVKANHPRPVQRRLPLRAEDPDPERTEEEWSKGRAILAELKAKIQAA
jgi:hypothetical protein